MLKNHIKGIQHVGIPVKDMKKTAGWYTENLDFETMATFNVEGIEIRFLRNGNMTLELYQFPAGDILDEIKARGNGHIDHIALDAQDILCALQSCKAKGLELETQKGSYFEIPECWEKGTKYFHAIGPNGDRVEFAEHTGKKAARLKNVEGWAHLGIPVTNIQQSQKFYEKLGFNAVMQCHLGGEKEEERIYITMMQLGDFTIELYQLLPKDLMEISARKDGHIDHVALDVDDVEAAWEDAHQEKHVFFTDKIESLPIWEKGCKYFIIQGPDGEKVEFNQVL